MATLPPPRFPSPPYAPPPIEQVAQQAMAAFEREFWAGHHSRPRLAAAPLRIAMELLFPDSGPPQLPLPPLAADADHQRLYGEALAAWTQLQHTRSRFEALVSHLNGPAG
jgi:hypothetical protein